jgi:thiamine biosynthesis lipoprotein
MRRPYYLLIVVLAIACKSEPNTKPTYAALSGEVIGTYYSIKYDLAADYSEGLDSLFSVLNESLSTYVPTATISRLNQGGDRFAYSKADPHFLPVLAHAFEYYQLTGGAFDPTVMPLVNFWGFGYEKVDRGAQVDSSEIKTLLPYVGLDKVQYTQTEDSVFITKPIKAELDFSASAKGYYIDVVGEWLASRGATNYLVDIGGETVARGVNPSGRPWTIGINTPSEQAGLQDIQLIMWLPDAAVASSGNYRNYRVASDGSKYVHTVDPSTGMSKQSDLSSATIVASDCMTADALATACNVLGQAEALRLIEGLDGVEGYFISPTKEGFSTTMTTGFNRYLVQ